MRLCWRVCARTAQLRIDQPPPTEWKYESSGEYQRLIDPQAVAARLSRDALPKQGAKTDFIQSAQLAAWFGALRQLNYPVMEGYLVGLLLTGARREELAELRR
ncbi:hypothetical protein AB1286_02650 [Trinickia sp. NRRL B-1857]|uniref:hypothetical protein n=1 Tax=Trinickia sp. NRRL B-1857 TaxID=3162879 RepID=UPI003D2BA409